MKENRLFLILSGLWAFTYIGSIVVLQITEPTGDGMTRGLNRLTSFLSWQVVAAFFAIGVWIAGNGLPKGSQARLFSRIPSVLAGVLILLALGVVVYAQTSKPTAPPESATGPTTMPVDVNNTQQSVYRGYFRSGFEQSDFYLKDGAGKAIWFEADGTLWDQINEHLVKKEGRGSFVTLELEVRGRLDDAGSYGHLGAYEKQLTATAITALLPMTQEAFDRAVSDLNKPGAD